MRTECVSENKSKFNMQKTQLKQSNVVHYGVSIGEDGL